jgi:hypothetical protein
MGVHERHRHFARRSSSACAKNADALRKMSFARRSSRTSRSSSFTRCLLGRRQPRATPVIPFRLSHPPPQRFRRAPDLLLANRPDRSALRRIFPLALEHQPHCALPDLCAYRVDLDMTPILPRTGASGKPRAVQRRVRSRSGHCRHRASRAPHLDPPPNRQPCAAAGRRRGSAHRCVRRWCVWPRSAQTASHVIHVASPTAS